MERPPLPPRHLQLDFQRELEEPPEENITLIDEPTPRVRQKGNAVMGLLNKMFPRPSAAGEEEAIKTQTSEPEELPQTAPQSSAATPVEEDNPLELHMIPLGSGREFQEIVEAEREEDMFGAYERLKKQRQNNAFIGFGIAVVIALVLIIGFGIDYLSEVVRARQDFELAGVIGEEQARVLGFLTGFAAPIVGFGLLQAALSRLIEGIRERRIRPLVIFIVAASGCVIGMTLAAHTNYASGFLILAVTAGITWILRGKQ